MLCRVWRSCTNTGLFTAYVFGATIRWTFFFKKIAQDIHRYNIVWNHYDSRHPVKGPSKGSLPLDPFDFRMAFIDFGSARSFPPNSRPLVQVTERPPDQFAAPEQLIEGNKYDMFAADVYNLGRVLQLELDEVDPEVRTTLLHFVFLIRNSLYWVTPSEETFDL